MEHKRIFEKKKPIGQSLLYMLIPISMAILSGAIVSVLKLEGIVVRAVQAVFFAIAFVIALIVAKKEGGALANVGFSSIKNVDKWLILAICINLLIYPFNFKNGFNKELSPIYVLVSFVFALVVGFTEETVFRGLIYRTLRYRGLSFAVLLSSFIFGAGHFATILGGANPLYATIQVTFACLIGLFFVLLVVKTRSLKIPIVLHALHNFTEYLRAGLSFKEEALFGGIACLLLLIGSLILWKSLSDDDKRAVTIDGSIRD